MEDMIEEVRDHPDHSHQVLLPFRSGIHARDGERHGIRPKRRFGDWRDTVRVYYLPEDPDTCQLTVDGVDVTSDDFAPAYLLTLDSTGSAKDVQIISSSGGDRIDSISFANNGDMLVGGSACWLQPTDCTLTGFGISLPVVDDGSDAWFARIGPGGEALWSMIIGSKGFDTIHSITEAPDGSIYIAGTFCQNYNLLCTFPSATTHTNQMEGQT